MTGAAPVAHVVAFYPPRLGGMERVAQALATGLAGDREVSVLTMSGSADEPVGATVEGHVLVRRFSSRTIAHTPLSWGILRALCTLPRGTLVHAHVAQAFLPELVALSSAYRRTPYVAHFHMEIEPSGVAGWLLRPYQRWVLGPVLRRAGAVLTLTAGQVDFLEQRYRVDRSRVHVVPNGPGAPIRRPSAPKQRQPGTALRLLFVGRLDAQKNPLRLIQAVARTHEPVTLTLVGTGEYAQAVDDLIAAEGSGRIRALGALRGEDLADAYAAADAVILASEREGMPLVLLETMAAGLPMVLTDVAGMRETAGDAALYAAPDSASLAEAIDTLAASPHRYDDLATRSWTLGQQTSWESAVTRCAQLYDDLLAGSRRPR